MSWFCRDCGEEMRVDCRGVDVRLAVGWTTHSPLEPMPGRETVFVHFLCAAEERGGEAEWVDCVRPESCEHALMEVRSTSARNFLTCVACGHVHREWSSIEEWEEKYGAMDEKWVAPDTWVSKKPLRPELRKFAGLPEIPQHERTSWGKRKPSYKEARKRATDFQDKHE